MKRSPLKRRTPLQVEGHSDTAQIKKEIQSVLRDIVIARDGGCIFSYLKEGQVALELYRILGGDFPTCNGYRKDGQLILQAEHLITRANSATFADSRLVVCICLGHHGWKSLGSNARKAQYDELVKQIISPDRVKLWEACERDSWKPHRTTTYDWKLAVAALKQELAHLIQKTDPLPLQEGNPQQAVA